MIQELEFFISWITTNPIASWFIIYALTIFTMGSVGFIIGSPLVGVVMGLAFVNATSLTWATLATASQPLWITMVIFIVSTIIVFYLIAHPHRDTIDNSPSTENVVGSNNQSESK